MNIPMLTPDHYGKKDVVGWFFEEKGEQKKLMPIFQCPICNERAPLSLHSIDQGGKVMASVLCNCGKFHEFVTLEQWPKNMVKKEGMYIAEVKK